MKKYLNANISLISFLILASFSPSIIRAETKTNNFSEEALFSFPDTSGFQSDSILKMAILVDDYIRLVKHPDYWNNTKVGGTTRPSNIWTRGVFYEGHMALYYVHKDTTLYNYAYNWAKSHNWEMGYKKNTTTDGDNQCCGQTYLELYKLYSHTKNVEGGSGLFNKADGFWWRDKNFDPPKVNSNSKQIYWSRGNGWVYAALTRVLNTIPQTETHYNEFLNDYLAMSRSLIACQREDGFWNPSLADPNEYGGKETSGTSMFVFGLAWGLNNGILDRETYLMAAKKGWTAISRDAIHNNGFIGWMQGTGDDPSDDQPLSYDNQATLSDEAHYTIETAGWPSGVYVVRIEDIKKVQVLKYLK